MKPPSHPVVAGTASGRFENRCLRKDGAVVDVLWATHWSAERQAFFCVAHAKTGRRRDESAVPAMNGVCLEV